MDYYCAKGGKLFGIHQTIERKVRVGRAYVQASSRDLWAMNLLEHRGSWGHSRHGLGVAKDYRDTAMGYSHGF